MYFSGDLSQWSKTLINHYTPFLASESTRLKQKLMNSQFKAPANEGALLRKHSCGNIVSLMFPRLRALKTFAGETFFAFEQQKVFLNFFQKHFVAAANVSCARKRGNIVVETFYVMFPRQVSI